MQEISIHEAGALLAAAGRIMVCQGVHFGVLVGDCRDGCSDNDMLEIMGDAGVPEERARQLLSMCLNDVISDLHFGI